MHINKTCKADGMGPEEFGDLEELIKKKSRTLKNREVEIKTLVEELKPRVVNHFNKYMKGVVNPAMPWGYGIIESEYAFYEFGKGFTVHTGPYKTPEGTTEGPLSSDIEDAVNRLLHDYQKKSPWVAKIIEGFSYGK